MRANSEFIVERHRYIGDAAWAMVLRRPPAAISPSRLMFVLLARRVGDPRAKK
jgi:hypothetical protein